MIITAIIGLIGIGGGFIGYLNGKLSMPLRLLSCAAGLCLVIPGSLTDVIGVVGVVAVFVITRMENRKTASVESK